MATMLAQWCFKPFPSLTATTYGIHLVVCRLLDWIMSLAVRDGLDNSAWVMPLQHYSTMLGGFIICILQLLLPFLGVKAFPSCMYPASHDCDHMTFDMVAVLDMNGIDC